MTIFMNRQYLFWKDAFYVLLSLVFGNSLLCFGQESKSANPYIDRDRFPEAYSILTSEHIMFPDKVSNLPIKIDSKRQLFIDDYMIASAATSLSSFICFCLSIRPLFFSCIFFVLLP